MQSGDYEACLSLVKSEGIEWDSKASLMQLTGDEAEPSKKVDERNNIVSELPKPERKQQQTHDDEATNADSQYLFKYDASCDNNQIDDSSNKLTKKVHQEENNIK